MIVSWDVSTWMAIIYPLLSAALAVYLALQCLYYLSVRPIRLVAASTCYFVCEFAVTTMLSLAAGSAPVVNFDFLRPWIVVARAGMLLSVWWMIIEMAIMLWRVAHAKRSDLMEGA